MSEKMIKAALRLLTRRPISPRTADEFSYFETSLYKQLVPVLILVVALETLVVHLLIEYLMPTGTLKLFVQLVQAVTGIYACVWMVADYRLLQEGRYHFGATCLSIRLGGRFSVEIPFRQIQAIESYVAQAREVALMKEVDKQAYFNARKSAVDVMIWDKPNVKVKLSSSIKVVRPFGLSKVVTEINLFVENQKAFVERGRKALNV